METLQVETSPGAPPVPPVPPVVVALGQLDPEPVPPSVGAVADDAVELWRHRASFIGFVLGMFVIPWLMRLLFG